MERVMLSTGCDPVFQLLEQANRKEREVKGELERTVVGVEQRMVVKVVIALAFFITIVLAVVAQKGFHSSTSAILLGINVCLTIIYLGVFYFPIAEIWLRRNEVRTVIREPFRIVLSNAKLTTYVDDSVFGQLMELKLEVLQKALMQLTHEFYAFQRRMGLIIGSLDKLGLFPALLAYLVAFFKIGDLDSKLVAVIVYSLPFLYFAGFYAQHLLIQLERNTRLLELVITHKQDCVNTHNTSDNHLQGAHS